ncbi:MAG: hypothetical protein ACYS1C_06995 [Planctomycetota bacterium]|jgi:hypothetical protein
MNTLCPWDCVHQFPGTGVDEQAVGGQFDPFDGQVLEEHVDARTNFSIHDVDTATGEGRVIREGSADQPVPD